MKASSDTHCFILQKLKVQMCLCNRFGFVCKYVNRIIFQLFGSCSEGVFCASCRQGFAGFDGSCAVTPSMFPWSMCRELTIVQSVHVFSNWFYFHFYPPSQLAMQISLFPLKLMELYIRWASLFSIHHFAGFGCAGIPMQLSMSGWVAIAGTLSFPLYFTFENFRSLFPSSGDT